LQHEKENGYTRFLPASLVCTVGHICTDTQTYETEISKLATDANM